MPITCTTPGMLWTGSDTEFQHIKYLERTKTMTYEDEITFVAELIVKASRAFNGGEAEKLAAAYSGAYLLGYEMQREATNNLVQSAMTEALFLGAIE